MALAARHGGFDRLTRLRVRIPWPRRGAGATSSQFDLPEIDLDMPPRGDRPRRLIAAAALLPAMVVGGIVVWLSVTADDTMKERAARIPRVVVPVTGTTAGPAPPAPGEPNPIDASAALAPAPVEGLTEPSPVGPLPRIAADGRTAWQAYARPFVHADPRPRIALVVADLGLSAAATAEAIRELPGAVTLAFAPHVPHLPDWVAQARQAGHEILLNLPLEPVGYPQSDPGPNTLLTRLGAEENTRRLHWALAQATGYVGVTSLSGSRFTAEPEALRPILGDLNARGLLWLDARASARSQGAFLATGIGMPRVLNDSFVDRTPAPAAIDAELAALEDIARTEKAAVGILSPYPITLQRLREWLPTLKDKGIALAPVTAVVNRQPDR